MNLIALFAVLFQIVYSQTRLSYDSTGTNAGIKSYNFVWQNPSVDPNAQSTGPNITMIAVLNDIAIRPGIILNSVGYGVWGPSGMTGTFMVDSLVPGSGNQYFKITEMSITFISTGCITSAQSEVSAFYYAPSSTTKVIITDVTLSEEVGDSTNGYWSAFTYTVTSATGFAVNNDMGIGFYVTMDNNRPEGCPEGDMAISEFYLKGEAVTSEAPTLSPSTTSPTMAPTHSCKGEVTWGDPHFTLLAVDYSVPEFNYQGLGWYYYLFPCDIANNYEDWPFFVLAEHTTCWWKGNPYGCISNNRLILNTKPEPWIFEFTDRSLTLVQIGTDVAGRSSSDFNLNDRYHESDPLVIDYDDGGASTHANNGVLRQFGQLRIFHKDGNIVLQLYDVAYLDYHRTCNKGETQRSDCPGDHMCDGQVIEIRNYASWTVFSCPLCLRNIACGLTGMYVRGDCHWDEVNDPTNQCYNILLGADGVTYAPPNGDAIFGQFADTWHADYVHDILTNNAQVPVHKSVAVQPLRGPEGRAMDLQVVDASYYAGLCKNDLAKIGAVNDTCRLNTVVKYERCCQEIGICGILWRACIEDLCACTAPGGNNTLEDAQCLDMIIHESMNTTCSWEHLWPTGTPTAAPTPSPTVFSLREVEGMDLIWLYLIFVIVFVVIAAVSYWYYRKKNGKVTFPEDEEHGDTVSMVEHGALNSIDVDDTIDV